MMRYCGLFHLEDIAEASLGGGPRCGSPHKEWSSREPTLPATQVRLILQYANIPVSDGNCTSVVPNPPGTDSHPIPADPR